MNAVYGYRIVSNEKITKNRTVMNRSVLSRGASAGNSGALIDKEKIKTFWLSIIVSIIPMRYEILLI